MMPTEQYANRRSHQSAIYQIVIQGHLSSAWSDWFDGFTITPRANGESVLVGPVIDQAALYGLLKKVHDLGLDLVAVNRLDPDDTVNRLAPDDENTSPV